MYVHAASLKNMGGKGSVLTAQVVGVNASRAWIRLAAGPKTFRAVSPWRRKWRSVHSAHLPHIHRHQPMICIFTFYALGLVELWKMSQKIGDLKILIRTLQTILCVGSLPDFKNHRLYFRQCFLARLALWIRPSTGSVGLALTHSYDMIFFSNTPWASYVILTKSFTLLSWPEGLPKSPKPRLFKVNSASNIRLYDE
jgi:hypothetical protein